MKRRNYFWLILLVLAWLAPELVLATALTGERNTVRREGSLVQVGVFTNTRIFAGSMVALNSSGYAVAAADAASYAVIGTATETVDNRVNAAGAGDSGTLTLLVQRGVFRWVNGDSFTDADIGSVGYVEDDQTVQKAASATHDVICGVIVDVDDDGVWCDTYNIGAYGAGSLTTLNTTGNAAIGGTLGVTGIATLSSNLVVTGTATVGKTLTVTGTGTGTAQAVLPAGAVDGTEILDETITAGDLASAVKVLSAATLSAVATPNANGGTNVVVVTAQDMGGSALAIVDQAVAFRCWIGDTAFSAPAAVAGDFAVSGGTEVQEIVSKADYIVATATNGTVTLTITDDPGRTNYLHLVAGGAILSTTELVWDTP